MAAQLTSAERTLRMLRRQDHDRVPRHDCYWPETLARWREEGFTGSDAEALDLLGGDLIDVCWSFPAPYRGQEEVVAEDDRTQTIRDEFGRIARWFKDHWTTPEHHGFEADCRATWERLTKPALLAPALHLDLDEARKTYAAGRASGRFCYMVGVETFEATRRMLGDEVTLIAMAGEPEWVVDVSRTYTDLVLRDWNAVWSAGLRPDGIWIYGDMAYNHATVCSPRMYRELVWPDHQRLIGWAHARDLPVIYHTDGDVNAVIPLYLEAGLDCLQPLEAKAGMDVRRLVPQVGDRMSFLGNIDMAVVGRNDPARIEAEVLAKLAAGMERSGYAYHSDHSVPPTVSFASYRQVIDLLDRHGVYG